MDRLRSPLIGFGLSFLVMAWAILPPALRHSHAGGGDSGHHHVALETHSGPHHHHEFPHTVHHAHDDASLVAPSRLVDRIVHFHWTVFGVHFSLPAGDSDGHGDDDANTTDAVLVRLVDDLPAASLRGDMGIGVDCCQPSKSTDRVSYTPTCHSRPDNTISSLPLCDSARFERSGVLLA